MRAGPATLVRFGNDFLVVLSLGEQGTYKSIDSDAFAFWSERYGVVYGCILEVNTKNIQCHGDSVPPYLQYCVTGESIPRGMKSPHWQ